MTYKFNIKKILQGEQRGESIWRSSWYNKVVLMLQRVKRTYWHSCLRRRRL